MVCMDLITVALHEMCVTVQVTTGWMHLQQVD